MPVEMQSGRAPIATDVGGLAGLMEWVRDRNGAVCVFMETSEGQAGFTVQANADGPRRDSFEYLESEIAGNTLDECVREVLAELKAQEAADRAT